VDGRRVNGRHLDYVDASAGMQGLVSSTMVLAEKNNGYWGGSIRKDRTENEVTQCKVKDVN
jgi:hypothetical protein